MIEAARSFVGTPFHHQGRLPGVGLDCVGVVVCARRIATGVDVDERGYGRQPNEIQLRTALLAAGIVEIPFSEAIPGDVIGIAFHRKQGIQHLALVTDRGMVHAHVNRDVWEEPITDGWLERTRAAWRLPEWEEGD